MTLQMPLDPRLLLLNAPTTTTTGLRVLSIRKRVSVQPARTCYRGPIEAVVICAGIVFALCTRTLLTILLTSARVDARAFRPCTAIHKRDAVVVVGPSTIGPSMRRRRENAELFLCSTTIFVVVPVVLVGAYTGR